MNYYKKAIEICATEQDWKGIVIEIAKLHPKFVVDASKSKSWEVEARKMYIENDDKIAAIKYCRTMTGASLRDAKEAVERLT